MSATTGTATCSQIARVMSRCWVIDNRLASGTPYAADNSKPLAQMPSNPASSASRADSGLCADISVTSPPAAIFSFKGPAIGAGLNGVLQLSQYRVAHLRGRDAGTARGDIAGPRAGSERLPHRVLDQRGLVGKVEGIAQHHREGEDAGQRVRQILAGNVGRAAMHRLIEGLASATCVGGAQRSRGQHPERDR